MKINTTLGHMERLSLLGCQVIIKDGVPHASVIGLAVARFNAAIHWLKVRRLRAYWKQMRQLDRCIGHGPAAFWESYMVLKYVCRQELPSRWFNRA